MKRKIYILVFIIAVFSVLVFFGGDYLAGSVSGSNFKYAGVNNCTASCHKGDNNGSQYEIWQNSDHSIAFKTLLTTEADQIAKEKGFNTPAAETPQCIKCHVLGKDINLNELENTFDITQGVQCETCHGPGSEFIQIPDMKNNTHSTDTGPVTHNNEEEFCRTCHNSNSPTFTSFNYSESWAKIKHPDPNLNNLK